MTVPLHVLVPRGGQPGQRLAAALASAGFKPLIVPLISFDPPRNPEPFRAGLDRLTARGFDWLILTSERTVDALAAQLPEPAPACTGTRVAAVGPSTAGRASEVGLAVDVVPIWEKSGRGLLAALTSRVDAFTRPTTAFVPHSNLARPEVSAGLRAAGWDVTEAEAYRTTLQDHLPPEAAAADVVLLTSSSTTTTWARLRAPNHNPVYVSIGPRTSETAHELGLPISATAPEPTVEALTATLTDVVRTPNTRTRT